VAGGGGAGRELVAAVILAPAKTRRAQRQQIGVTASVPSPVGGWNARDPIGSMDTKDAVALENWFPKPSQCEVRAGFADWATGIPGTVETIMPYNVSSAGRALFAVSNSAGTCAVYDATASGAVGAAVVTGLTNARLQHVNFTTPGGSFLFFVNGADAPRHWNGATWVAPTITGVTASTLVDVTVHKSRLFFAQAGTMSVWFLPVNSVAGAASEFPLGSVMRAGGSIAAVGNWTIDAGEGVDDHFVAISTEGEVAVYRGTDPTSANTWALVGVWQIGSPIGRRCLTKYAGDLLVVNKDGVLPMSAALQSTRVSSRVALTDKIQNAVSEATTLYGANFGWQMQLFPPENMLMLNVPVAAGISDQYVMNTITGAWCRFTGWNARCWALQQDVLYFGTGGRVCRAWTGTSDAGAPITATALPAFNYFGKRTQLKQFQLARPVLAVSNEPGLLVGLNVDFDTTLPVGVPSFVPVASSLWGTALWGVGRWLGGQTIRKDWQYVSGLGYCASMQLRVASTTARTQWASVDYLYTEGGVL
jgi:hypothetical protein